MKDKFLNHIRNNQVKIRKAVYTDYIINMLLIILGVIFIAIPDEIKNYIGLISLFYVLISFANSVVLFLINKNRLKTIALIVNITLLIAVIINACISSPEAYEFFAIIMLIVWDINICIDIENLVVNIKKKMKNLAFDIVFLLIDITFVIGMSISFQADVVSHIYLYGFFFVLNGIASLSLAAFYNRDKKERLPLSALYKVIRGSHIIEIFLGLVLGIVIASFILPNVGEPQIKTFEDALWYCFMLISTIGFGDITCVTAIGRTISVILGLYGIIIVALLTSVITNLYNERNTRRLEEKINKQNNQIAEPKNAEEHIEKQVDVNPINQNAILKKKESVIDKDKAVKVEVQPTKIVEIKVIDKNSEDKKESSSVDSTADQIAKMLIDHYKK